jgi:hypothetical protein
LDDAVAISREKMNEEYKMAADNMLPTERAAVFMSDAYSYNESTSPQKLKKPSRPIRN